MNRQFLCLATAILFLFSCAEEHTIDQELIDVINQAPDSKGVYGYILPSSNDFRAIPRDPQNPMTSGKIRLGQQLFHESGFGSVGKLEDFVGTYSCASCHHAQGGFQANMAQGIGEGGMGFGVSGELRMMAEGIDASLIDVQPLRTPSALNSAYQTNHLWNGQFGATALNANTTSVWPETGPIAINNLGYSGVETQAIAGLEVHRHEFDIESVKALGYKSLWDQVFADVPESDRYTRERAGLAIAAYERTLLANQAPFQRWLRGQYSAMSEIQKEGAMLFFGKANCVSCHNGPGLANMEFHALGMSDFSQSQMFNVKDDDPAFRGRGSFTKDAADDYKFKVPQLYNLKDSPFYGHGASFRSVREVLEYKNQAIAENAKVPTSLLSDKFQPLQLSDQEIEVLAAFVEDALYDPNLERYLPNSLLSGNCFPNNDARSRVDLNCD